MSASNWIVGIACLCVGSAIAFGVRHMDPAGNSGPNVAKGDVSLDLNQQPGRTVQTVPGKEIQTECDCNECQEGKFDQCKTQEKKERYEDRYWVGVQVDDASSAILDQLQVPCGQHVKYVISDSPAAGILHRNDVIHKFNGVEVGCTKTLGDLIQDNKETVAKLEVFRNGKKVKIELTPRKVRIGNYLETEQSDLITGGDQATDGVTTIFDREEGKNNQRVVYLVRQSVVVGKDAKSARNRKKERLNLVSVVSFQEQEDGKRLVVVHQGDQEIQYDPANMESLPKQIRRLVLLVAK